MSKETASGVDWCESEGLRHRVVETERNREGAIIRTACGRWLIPDVTRRAAVCEGCAS
ncbi:hypothetical protein [Amycolatopsis nigrescens]|uniref:hypothetical protein n=1 Tax=Amycolatopsis nigrescens TaxID=381445 RepID=UPI0012FC93BB|nr:hypothetical protein [Amycolatopsis nigrescens]